MALIIAINAALCFGVIVMVVAPLVWAILTQHRDTRAIVAAHRRRRLRAATQSAGRAPRPQHEPVAWAA